MKAAGERQIWLWAAAGGFGVLAALMLLFRGPVTEPRTVGPVPGGSSVGLAKLNGSGTDSLLREEAILRDPTPLFLPTIWNAAEGAFQASTRREPGGSFEGYRAKLSFAEPELQMAMSWHVAMPTGVSDALGREQAAESYWGLARSEPAVPALAARGAFVEVVTAGGGVTCLSLPLAKANPPAQVPWQPLQFLVTISPVGLVGSPVLIESSRVAGVDDYFRSYISDTLRVGERLGPGFYRISIGP